MGSAPKNWGDNITVVVALGHDGLHAPLVLRGSLDTETFLLYLEKFLAPVLRPGHTLLMDNLSVHKAAAVRQIVEARGARLVFLPPYSPDLSPIERAWSKAKTLMRRAAARTWDQLVEAAGSALGAIVRSDAAAWFNHCGYRLQS